MAMGNGFPGTILPDTAAQTPTVPTVPVPPGLRSTAEVGMLLQLIPLADACSPFYPLLILNMIVERSLSLGFVFPLNGLLVGTEVKQA